MVVLKICAHTVPLSVVHSSSRCHVESTKPPFFADASILYPLIAILEQMLIDTSPVAYLLRVTGLLSPLNYDLMPLNLLTQDPGQLRCVNF